MKIPEHLQAWYDALPDDDTTPTDDLSGLRVRRVYTKRDAKIDMEIAMAVLAKLKEVSNEEIV